MLQRQTEAHSFWDWLLSERKFQKQMHINGYYAVEKNEELSRYKRYLKLSGLDDNYPSQNISFTEEYLPQMPEPLRREGMYLVRTGNGNSIVFSSFLFQPPFMYLSRIATSILTKKRRGYDNLRRAIREQWNERTFIDFLHFSGALKAIVRQICGAKEYHSGPSGLAPAFFPFYMKDKKRNTLARFVFHGNDDLDECLYPQGSNIVIPIEAKLSLEDGLGWHKLAFPCYRFINKSISSTRPSMNPVLEKKDLRIVPMYCAFDPQEERAYIYVFPRIKVHKLPYDGNLEHGLVLNEQQQFTPHRVFIVDIKKYC
jgi:hypothetical protein